VGTWASTEHRLDELPTTFSHAQAQQYGLTDRPLYRLLRIGRIELIGRGLYRRTDAPLPSDDDLLEIAHKTPDATLCLTSALAHHGLSDAIPAAYDIAIPRGRYKPTVRAPVSWHTFDPATFDIGRTLLPIDAESSIGLYDPKRCIIDAFRLRRLEGPELGIEALKRWLRLRGSSPAKLLECAEPFPSAQRALEETLVILL
jgi:hypothetical protein